MQQNEACAIAGIKKSIHMLAGKPIFFYEDQKKLHFLLLSQALQRNRLLGLGSWDVGDGESCKKIQPLAINYTVVASVSSTVLPATQPSSSSTSPPNSDRNVAGNRTWWERLLELLGLLSILEDEGVEVSVASDLELDLVLGRALLFGVSAIVPSNSIIPPAVRPSCSSFVSGSR